MPERRASLYLKWRDHTEEIEGLAELIARMLADDDGLDPRDVCVIAPGATWSRLFASCLGKRALRSSSLLGASPLAGDLKKPETCPGWAAYARLRLAARPDDPKARELWEQLELEGDCNALVERARRLRGVALLNVIAGSPVPRDFAELVGDIEGTEGIEELYVRANDALVNPRFSARSDRVRLASFKTAALAEPRVLLIAGAVEGLVPSRACFEDDLLAIPRPEALESARQAFVSAASLPTESLIISTFQLLGEPAAKSMGVPVLRWKTVDGVRLAAVSPSRFISDLGTNFPGSVSGEQYLAR